MFHRISSPALKQVGGGGVYNSELDKYTLKKKELFSKLNEQKFIFSSSLRFQTLCWNSRMHDNMIHSFQWEWQSLIHVFVLKGHYAYRTT